MTQKATKTVKDSKLDEWEATCPKCGKKNKVDLPNDADYAGVWISCCKTGKNIKKTNMGVETGEEMDEVFRFEARL